MALQPLSAVLSITPKTIGINLLRITRKPQPEGAKQAREEDKHKQHNTLSFGIKALTIGGIYSTFGFPFPIFSKWFSEIGVYAAVFGFTIMNFWTFFLFFWYSNNELLQKYFCDLWRAKTGRKRSTQAEIT